jgi:Methyltransferase domain
MKLSNLYPSSSLAWRVWRFAASTVLGGARRGYFIPYRYAEDLPQPHAIATYDPIENKFADRLPAFCQLLDTAETYRDDLMRIGTAPAPAPRFDQDWFPTLDAVAAYCMVRKHRPARMIEIGSGHSTRFFYHAIKDEGFVCDFTAIDPAPRAVIQGLDINFVGATLDKVDLTVFDQLQAGDLLSIDSSHILMPGTDVDDLLNRVLPRLPVGVLVHIHDIFLPAPYPESWTWRGYNEQQGVAPLITSGAYDVLFASHYMTKRQANMMADGVVGELPSVPGSLPASLWLEKQG